MTLLELEQALDARQEEMGGYLTEIRSYPRLTPQQERELAMACAAGDEEAIRRMVCSNLRLVVSIAREYAGRGVPLLDLIQEGSIGLLVATRKFDYTLDFRFSTYATKWIRHNVTRYLLNHGQMIRVPVHTAERMKKILAVKAALTQENGGLEPTEEEIAEKCDIPVEKGRQLLQMYPETCSLDAPAGEDDGGTLGLLVEDLQALQPQEELVRAELNRMMEQLMGMLKPRQQQVLRLRFGMEDGTDHSLEEIGTMLGISKERARQIERQAMEKLLKLGSGMGLEEFLNE